MEAGSAFAFDPIERAVGAPLADTLESLVTGPVYRRPSGAGPAVEVYPLALPDGEGATVPPGAAGWLREKLGDALVRGHRWLKGWGNLCPNGVKIADAQALLNKAHRFEDVQHPDRFYTYEDDLLYEAQATDMRRDTWHGYPVLGSESDRCTS